MRSADVMRFSKLSLTEGENDSSIKYASWLMEHPSALDKFEEMKNATKGKKIVLFLDYDGTLSDFVPNPEEAFMTDRMRMVLYEVANHFPTAIISGRKREKVQEFVRLRNVYYAGSQGLDIEVPNLDLTNSNEMDNKVVLYQPTIEFLAEKEKILNQLSNRTKDIQGVNIEDNKFCISVHYRSVQPKDADILVNVIYVAVFGMEEQQNFRLTTGKKVYEVVPDIVWNKGHALKYFLENLGFGNSDDVLPIYIGDDESDEDAFEVLRKKGQGFPIVVTAAPKDTKALYSLREPKEVMEFLLRLLAMA